MDYWKQDILNDPEVNELLYGNISKIALSIKRLFVRKHIANVIFNHSQDIELKKFTTDTLVVHLRVQTETGDTNLLEIRFFLDSLTPKNHCTKMDEDAHLDKDKLSWANLILLRILWTIFTEIKYFSKQENAWTICGDVHCATIWIANMYSGSIGRHGGIVN